MNLENQNSDQTVVLSSSAQLGKSVLAKPAPVTLDRHSEVDQVQMQGRVNRTGDQDQTVVLSSSAQLGKSVRTKSINGPAWSAYFSRWRELDPSLKDANSAESDQVQMQGRVNRTGDQDQTVVLSRSSAVGKSVLNDLAADQRAHLEKQTKALVELIKEGSADSQPDRQSSPKG